MCCIVASETSIIPPGNGAISKGEVARSRKQKVQWACPLEPKLKDGNNEQGTAGKKGRSRGRNRGVTYEGVQPHITGKEGETGNNGGPIDVHEVERCSP